MHVGLYYLNWVGKSPRYVINYKAEIMILKKLSHYMKDYDKAGYKFKGMSCFCESHIYRGNPRYLLKDSIIH